MYKLATIKQRNPVRIYGIIAAVLPPLLTFIAYLPALKNGFVNWDDNVYIYENRNISSFGLDFIKWSFSNSSVGHWHPLTWLSLALDYSLWGPDPWGFHLTNIILHSLNTLLVFILAVWLIGVKDSESYTWRALGPLQRTMNFEAGTIVAAFVTALLFGIHPVHVESVAWATERKDVLSLLFFLTTLLSYIKYNSTVGLKKGVYYGSTLLLFIMALMSKPMAVTLPIVLLIIDFYPFRRLTWKNSKWVVVEKMPFFALSLISSIITIWAAASAVAVGNNFSFLTRLFISARGYMFYILKMIAPINLAPLYPYPAKVNIFAIEYLGSAILLFSLTIYCIWSLRRSRLYLAVWLYYLVTLIPVIGIVHAGPQDNADRYTYLPGISLFLLIGVALGDIFKRYPKRILSLAVLLLFLSVVLTNKTVNQIKVWHDSITLWTYETRLFPDSFMAHGKRGEAYIDLGYYKFALSELNKAIELNIGYSDEYYNRGKIYYIFKNYRQAINDFNRAIELSPRALDAYNNRGSAFFALGDYESATTDYKKVIELDIRHAEAHYNLGLVYSKLGDNEQALTHYKKAAGLGLKQAQDSLSRLLESKGVHHSPP